MKTRDILKAVFFVAGVIILAAACNKKEDSPTLEFEIKVPEDWRFYIINQNNSVYYAQSPISSSTDSVIEDMQISRFDGTGYSLGTFFNAYEAELRKDTTYEMISAKDTSINGVSSRQLIHLLRVYAVSQSNGDTVHLDAKLLKYMMLNNNYAYVISFNALESTFDSYRPVFDTIISSFKFKP